MLDIKSLVLMLLSSSWGVTTVVLVAAVIYRGVLSTREDDQIFIGNGEDHYIQEQRDIIARISRAKGSDHRAFPGFRRSVSQHTRRLDLSGLFELLEQAVQRTSMMQAAGLLTVPCSSARNTLVISFPARIPDSPVGSE